MAAVNKFFFGGGGYLEAVRKSVVVRGIRVEIRVGSHREVGKHRTVFIESGRESAWRPRRRVRLLHLKIQIRCYVSI